MQIGSFSFDRVEFAGSLGDLGTLIPLSVALIIINGLSVTAVFLMVGLFYIASGLYFKLPVPVQPLKVVSAIAIAFPLKVTASVIAASGLIFGVILLLLAFTGLIDWLARFFTRPIVRGIQLGLGLILITKGIEYIRTPALFIQQPDSTLNLLGIPLNLLIGIAGGIVTLLLLSSRRFPASIVLVFGGVIIGIFSGALNEINFSLGPTPIAFITPGWADLYTAAIFLVIPQIPLTIGNAIVSTSDTCISLFGENSTTRRVSYRALAISMGCINLLTSGILGMPMCHGAGGLAAHHRFGARNGGSNLMIGLIFLVIALVFGTIGISLLMLIPNAVLGILLLFAGLELSFLIRDLTEKNDLMITLLVASVGFATTNMGLAFLIGILIQFLLKRAHIKL